MGLKEKAIAAQKKTGSAGALTRKKPESELTPEEAFEKDFSDKLKKKSKIQKDDLLFPIEPEEQELSSFLLPDETDTQTLPSDSIFPLQNRLESLLNLLEVCKELASVENEEDLWNSVVFNILGQVAAKEVAIFFKENQRLFLKAVKGFIIPEEFQLSKRSGIERVLAKDLSIHYSDDVIKRVVGDEQNLLKSLNAELIVPVLHYSELCGFMIIGRPISGDFHPDDLLYVKLMGELLGSFHNTIEKIAFMDTNKRNWIERDKQYHEFIYFQNRLQYSSTLPEAQSVLQDYLDQVFHFHTYLFLIKEEKDFIIHSQKGLQEKTLKKFRIKAADAWVMEIKNKNDWTPLTDFKSDAAFMKYFSSEDKAIIREIHVLPLHLHGNMAGIFLLFDIVEASEVPKLSQSRMLLMHYFWYAQIELLSEALHIEGFKAQDEPLFALEALIAARENKLKSKEEPYCVYTVYIANGEQLRNLLNDQGYQTVKKAIKKGLRKNFGTVSYLSEAIPDRFLLILDSVEKNELWKLDKRFHKDMQKSFGEVSPILQSRLYARPDDDVKSIETLLFL